MILIFLLKISGYEILQDGLSEADMDDMVASFLASLTLMEVGEDVTPQYVL